MQTPQNTDLTAISDLNTAESGSAFFDATTANKPSGVTDAGTVHTTYHGDIGWQMLIANDAPREFWQRTRKPAAPYWRNWRKFGDFRTVNDAIDAAIATAGHIDADTVRNLIAEHGAAEADARDTAIASAVSSAVSNIPQGLDRMAVETIVDSRLDDELDDERAARNDTINTAINTSTTAIITGRQGAIDAAIITERAAIDRSVDSKTGIIDAKVTTLDAKLESERSDRIAANTAEVGRREAAIRAEAEARGTAIRALDTKVTGDIATAERRSDTKLETAIAAEAAQRSTDIQSKIGEARVAINGAIASAVATERDARMAADRAADRAMTTQIANSGFPSGTKMLFQQSSAPTGWTKDTVNNDKALRVVSGAVGSGGSASFSSVFRSKSVQGSISNRVSGSVSWHVLTLSQIPPHNHDFSGSVSIRGGHGSTDANAAGLQGVLGGGNSTFRFSGQTNNRGGGQGHHHDAGTLSVNSTFRGNPIDMRVRYVDVIIATKD